MVRLCLYACRLAVSLYVSVSKPDARMLAILQWLPHMPSCKDYLFQANPPAATLQPVRRFRKTAAALVCYGDVFMLVCRFSCCQQMLS